MTYPVLYIETPTILGGAELGLLDLVCNLDRSRFTPTVLTSGPGPLAERATNLGIALEIQPFPWFRRRNPLPYAQALFRIAALIRRRHVALVHTNCDRSIKYVVPVARTLGVPCVCHVRDFQRAWHRPDYVRYLNQADCVIAISAALAQECLRNGVREDKLRVIHDAIAQDAFANVGQAERVALRQELGIAKEAPVVGIVGQVLPKKGVYEFVEAAPLIVNRVPDTHFLIVGDDRATPEPDFLSSLQAQVLQLGLDGRVHFLGFREDIPAVMAALDVLAVPSHDEGFGRVVVEGMAARKAVVATNVGGIPEIIENNCTGCLVPPRDAQVLATTIIELLENSEKRVSIGQVACQVARERFDLPNYVQRIQQLYTTLLQSNSRKLRAL